MVPNNMDALEDPAISIMFPLTVAAWGRRP